MTLAQARRQVWRRGLLRGLLVVPMLFLLMLFLLLTLVKSLYHAPASPLFPPIGPYLHRQIDPILRDWAVLSWLWSLIPLPSAPLTIAIVFLGSLAAIMLAALLAALLAAFFDNSRQKGKTEESLEAQLDAALHMLQVHSHQATQLLVRLQQEMTDRNTAMQGIETQLQELRHQQVLLELTSEQRHAIEGLIRRRPSAKDIFTSLDFWLGRVVPGAFFFTMGLLASWLARR